MHRDYLYMYLRYLCIQKGHVSQLSLLTSKCRDLVRVAINLWDSNSGLPEISRTTTIRRFSIRLVDEWVVSTFPMSVGGCKLPVERPTSASQVADLTIFGILLNFGR